MITELTMLRLDTEDPRGHLTIVRLLAALSLLQCYATEAPFTPDRRAHYLRTVADMVDAAVARHMAKLLHAGPMPRPEPEDPDWNDWYRRAVTELRDAHRHVRGFHRIPAPTVGDLTS